LEAERVEALRRLGRARLFTAARVTPQASDTAPGRAWLDARGRRGSNGTRLLVFGTCLIDGRGALIETLIVPVVARTNRELEAVIDAALRCAERQIRQRCTDIAEPRITVLERLASRERHIAATCAVPVADGLFQPGLFDRRAERAVRSRAERVEHSRLQLSLRLAALDAARLVHPPEAVDLLLVRLDA
jgi:hypothetical protein